MVKKKNNSKIYFGLFIAFLMISSTVGFMYGGGAETKKINGYKFTKVDGGWQTYIEEIESYWRFTYLPNEINFDIDFGEFNVYPENELSKPYTDKIKFIMLYSGKEVEILDEKNCDGEIQLLILNHSYNDVIISEEENCILVNGNLNKFVDGLTYKIFGVI
jgi:hypothetical protein